jgi:hypothetical protein
MITQRRLAWRQLSATLRVARFGLPPHWTIEISDGLEQRYGLLMYVVNFMVKPNGLLVLVSSTHCCAYTPSLSTW